MSSSGPIADHIRGSNVVDYVIAATADVPDAELFTLNVKHFPMFDGLTSPF